MTQLVVDGNTVGGNIAGYGSFKLLFSRIRRIVFKVEPFVLHNQNINNPHATGRGGGICST